MVYLDEWRLCRKQLSAKIKRASVIEVSIFLKKKYTLVKVSLLCGKMRQWCLCGFFCCCRWISPALHRWYSCRRWFQTWWYRRKRLPSWWKWKWLWPRRNRIHPHPWWKWLFSRCGWGWGWDRWPRSHRKWPHHYRAEWVVLCFYCFPARNTFMHFSTSCSVLTLALEHSKLVDLNWKMQGRDVSVIKESCMKKWPKSRGDPERPPNLFLLSSLCFL